jgi:GNAT superfamily N-acetyltransferase
MITISTNKRAVRPAEAAALYVEMGWGDAKRYSAERMKCSLAHCDIVLSARNEAGELVGLLRALSDFAIETKVLDMVIDPEYQRQGIGKRIMRALETLVPGTTIYCETGRQNFRFLLDRHFKKRPGLVVFRKTIKMKK